MRDDEGDTKQKGMKKGGGAAMSSSLLALATSLLVVSLDKDDSEIEADK